MHSIKIQPGQEDILEAFRNICFYHPTSSYSCPEELQKLSEQLLSGSELEGSWMFLLLLTYILR